MVRYFWWLETEQWFLVNIHEDGQDGGYVIPHDAPALFDLLIEKLITNGYQERVLDQETQRIIG